MLISKASEAAHSKFDVIPTGFSSLDKILGIGGIPFKKITECSGQFSVGKSTLALQIVSQAQKLGYKCLWVDSEYSWSEDYSVALGVDTDKLELLTGRFAEEILDGMEEWAEKNKNSLIVLDSVGGLLPRQEGEKSSEQRTIGGQAKLIATFTRKITPILAINNIALLVLNHNFIDLLSGKIMTSGGLKLAYSKSVWLMLRANGKYLAQGDKKVGNIIEAEIRKNKLAPTLKQTCELSMIWGEGFSKEADLMEQLLASGEVTKRGNTFFRGETKLGVGLSNARKALKTTA